MKHISSFFSRFTAQEARDKEIKKEARDSVLELLGLSLDVGLFTFDQDILRIGVSGAIKTELLLRKKTLITRLKEKGIIVRDIK